MSRRMSAWVGFTALLLVVFGVLPVAAQGLLYRNASTSTAGIEPSFGIGVGVRKYFNSFTSWQFPNRFPPNQDPYSRLEWPWDQTFFVAR
ncbi:MAG: hypothetical protein QG577_2286, partial [Thermodesulfobacteriota bacterium]|nr:hypothetical protein [Thermodesulfobacteriota bacterium]